MLHHYEKMFFPNLLFNKIIFLSNKIIYINSSKIRAPADTLLPLIINFIKKLFNKIFYKKPSFSRGTPNNVGQL